MMIPGFVRKLSAAALHPAGWKQLVIIQLGGGNDGLNTVVPYEQDWYYQLRPKIGIPKSQVLTLDQGLGLHPSLTAFKELYDQGQLAVINKVGYPNPDRSHFRSMDIWQSASNANETWNTGWIGRYLDAQPDPYQMHRAIEADDTLSLAMKGELRNAMACRNPQMLYQSVHDGFLQDAAAAGSLVYQDPSPDHYLYQTMAQTIQSADYIYQQQKIYTSAQTYPAGQFGKDLKTMAELICSGCETKVYYISLGSFDTHVGQPERQAKLFQELSDGLRAFTADLKQQHRLEDTLVMTFSEFGRRAAENANRGTDHGVANTMFLIGGSLKKPGIYNEGPVAADLLEQDVQFSIDFRQIYATILQRWLSADATKILGRDFNALELI